MREIRDLHTNSIWRDAVESHDAKNEKVLCEILHPYDWQETEKKNAITEDLLPMHYRPITPTLRCSKFLTRKYIHGRKMTVNDNI